MPKNAPEPGATAPLESPAAARIAREIIALLIVALAAFAALSLASFDAGRGSNLCGPIGQGLAERLSYVFGYEAYLVTALAAGLGIEVWVGATWLGVASRMCGGALIIAAALAGAALSTSEPLSVTGATGAALGDILAGSLSFGGGYLVVALTVVIGLTLLVRRSPTDLASKMAGTFGLRHGDDDEEFAAGAALSISERFEPGTNGDLSRKRKIELRERVARDKSHRINTRPKSKDGFKLPPISTLDTPPLEHAQVDESALERSARVLEAKLKAFGVDGQVVEVQPGPVVTMYKFEPASGIKVSQIVNLADDLSMALKALAVRIQAPVPGEAVVGIEVPNRKREKVFLREILETEDFVDAHGQLRIALGKDISGQAVTADLGRMPHLLIAGATGTGKSVSIHTMIASILFNATADEVRFVLIDPKMLELSIYENIPHLLVPVVVDPEKAASALFWATQEMERRYVLMSDRGVRNIDGYNRSFGTKLAVVELASQQIVAEGPAASGAQSTPIEHKRLPKIVIVIDELADLLLSEGKSVERDITRLAAKARAAGIHLILATQRPSVDVITGLIKANLPARISFQVTSRVDSRTILDSIGAERLLGDGDMLFLPPGTAKLRRLHGPFVSEGEIRKVTDFLRAQGTPEYRMEILETRTPDSGGGQGDELQDEMYDEAVRIVMETNQASISMIQRRLRIGYNRAARMVEQMEREGLVAPADGAKPREVRGSRLAHS